MRAGRHGSQKESIDIFHIFAFILKKILSECRKKKRPVWSVGRAATHIRVAVCRMIVRVTIPRAPLQTMPGDLIKNKRTCRICRKAVLIVVCGLFSEILITHDRTRASKVMRLQTNLDTLYMKVLRVVYRVQHDTKYFIDETQPKGFTDTL